jgi:hypothetical protein
MRFASIAEVNNLVIDPISKTESLLLIDNNILLTFSIPTKLTLLSVIKAIES